MVILVLVLFVLLTMTFDFSVLTSICTGSRNKSVCEFLEFVIAAHHKVNVICKTLIADWSATDRDRGVVFFKVYLIIISKNRLKSIGESSYPCLHQRLFKRTVKVDCWINPFSMLKPHSVKSLYEVDEIVEQVLLML